MKSKEVTNMHWKTRAGIVWIRCVDDDFASELGPEGKKQRWRVREAARECSETARRVPCVAGNGVATKMMEAAAAPVICGDIRINSDIFHALKSRRQCAWTALTCHVRPFQIGVCTLWNRHGLFSAFTSVSGRGSNAVNDAPRFFGVSRS